MSLRPSGSRISRLSSSPSLLLIAEAFPRKRRGARLRGQSTIADGSRHDCLRAGSQGLTLPGKRGVVPDGGVMDDTGRYRDEAARESAALAAVDPAAVDEAGSALPASSDLRPDKPVVPGDCLPGRFLIEQELGRGGAGTVFIAQDRT